MTEGAVEIEKVDVLELIKDKPADEVTAYLAKLPRLEIEEYSKKICQHRGWTTKTLRTEIAKATASEEIQGAYMFIEDLQPAENPIQGQQLATTINDLYQAHIKAGEHDYSAITLWTFLTYCYDEFDILTKLLLKSPQKRCGKSTLLEMLEALVYKGKLASGISSASIYRAVDMYKPCLLLDEADAYMKQDENMRGIVNAGHKRRSAHIVRCEGDPIETKDFSLWSPMAISGIGKQAGTIMDRSIVINMRRKLPGEIVHKIPRRFYENNRVLRKQLLRWSQDNKEALHVANPPMPHSDNDRATDNWHPLFCIAEVIGGDWPQKALCAFEEAAGLVTDEDNAIMLLEDLQKLFSSNDRLHSGEIISKLVEMEDRPWSEFIHNTYPISKNRLAEMLKEFDIRPKQMKFNGVNLRGYKKQFFAETFARYLPPPETATPLPVNDTASVAVAPKVAGNTSRALPTETEKVAGSTLKNKVAPLDIQNATPEPNGHAGCSGVALPSPPMHPLIDSDEGWKDMDPEVIN